LWFHDTECDGGSVHSAGGGIDPGECIIFNALTADTPQVNRFVLAPPRQVILGKETAYFKRFNKDGRARPVRVNVNEFVADHISRPGGARMASSPRPQHA
jgi:hypothetical protein